MEKAWLNTSFEDTRMMGRDRLPDDVRMSISGGSVRGMGGLATVLDKSVIVGVARSSGSAGLTSGSSMYSSPISSSSCGGWAGPFEHGITELEAMFSTSSSMGQTKSLTLTTLN